MNGDAERFLKCRTNPVQKIRAALISLGRDERDVRVLERRLARRDAARPRAVELARGAARSARARRVVWTTSSCFWSRSSTATAVTPSIARRRTTVGSSTPKTSISVTRPPVTLSFSCAGVPFADDLAFRDHGDPVAERVGLEHVVGRQQHGLAGRRPGRRSSGAGRARRRGRRRSSARRGRRPRGRAGSRARCAAAAACRASSPRRAPARGPSGRRARAPRRSGSRCALPETP